MMKRVFYGLLLFSLALGSLLVAQAETQPTVEELLKLLEAQKKLNPPTPSPKASTVSSGKTYTNSIGIEFVLIPAGEFVIGQDCPADNGFTKVNEFSECKGRVGSAYPPKKVMIDKSFYMGKYEVTQEQWVKIMGTKENSNNPSHFQSEDVGGDSRQHPVEQVTWLDTQEFVKRLNGLEKTNRYRLPTEAEFEYALRVGTTTEYFFGDDVNQLGEYAWFSDNSKDNSNGQTHPVGQKKPNPFGLYDILGNVWEWTCSDYADKYGSGKESTCSDNTNGNKSVRGGSWNSNTDGTRSAYRNNNAPTDKSSKVGFRLVLISP